MEGGPPPLAPDDASPEQIRGEPTAIAFDVFSLVGDGVIAAHYATVEESLLWALGQALEAGFDGEVRAAWRKVIQRVSKAMKEGAALAPAVR